MDHLFRHEVNEARRGQWLGSVHLAIPMSFLWLALLGIALAAAIVLFMVLGHYTRYARVQGKLVPSAGLLDVRSITAGTVERVYVHVGEAVQQGEPLVEVSGERGSALGSTQALIGAQLRATAKRLHAKLANERQSSAQQAAALRVKIDSLRQQTSLIRSQLVLEKHDVASADEMLNSLQSLRKRGYSSKFQLEQQKVAVSQMKSRVKDLNEKLLATRRHIAQAKQRLKALPLTLAAKQNATKRALSQNAQKIAKNELARDAVLRAPTDGIVSTLLVKHGQSVSAGQPLLSVLPKGSKLEAQLLVPSNTIGFVKPGSKVVMRYQAFPYQEFGQQYGHVVSVSRSALSNGEIATLTGRRSPQSLYLVLVALNQQTIKAYGKSNTLLPGMAINANIMLHRRSLWQLVFAPLAKLHQDASNRGA